MITHTEQVLTSHSDHPDSDVPIDIILHTPGWVGLGGARDCAGHHTPAQGQGDRLLTHYAMSPGTLIGAGRADEIAMCE